MSKRAKKAKPGGRMRKKGEKGEREKEGDKYMSRGLTQTSVTLAILPNPLNCPELACGSCSIPEPAGMWLMLVFPADNGDVEVNPEEDVDDEDGDEGPGHIGDCFIASCPLQPDINRENQATA